MPQRSTTLALFAERCPLALDLWESGADYPRDIFTPGVSAHACLQALGDAAEGRIEQGEPGAITAAVVEELCSQGRRWEDRHEPPLAIEPALAGRRLALDWWEAQPWPAGSECEQGLAVDSQWRPCAYDAPDVYYRGILDVSGLCFDGDQEGGAPGLRVRDYKSAWRAGADVLDSLQIKGQALLALAHADEAPLFVLQEVGNLRTRQIASRQVWLDDQGQEQVEAWRQELDTAIRAAERRPRQARPGACCVGCPYLRQCKPGQDWAAAVDLDSAAVEFALTEARRRELSAMLRAGTDRQSWPVEGGVVGYVGQVQRTPRPTAALQLAAAWWQVAPDAVETWAADHSTWLSLLDALDLGVGQVEAVAKRLHHRATGRDWKAQRQALIASLLDTIVVARFGVHAAAADDEEDACAATP